MRGLLRKTGGLHQALSASWLFWVATRSRREPTFDTQVQQDQCHSHSKKASAAHVARCVTCKSRHDSTPFCLRGPGGLHWRHGHMQLGYGELSLMALVQDIYVDVCLPRPHADEIAQLARVSQGGVLGAANRLGQQSKAGRLCRAAPAASACTLWAVMLAKLPA